MGSNWVKLKDIFRTKIECDMKLSKVFKPVGRSSKKGQRHRKRMFIRAGIMRKNISPVQSIASYIVAKVCKEYNLSHPKFEKVIFCKSSRRFYIGDIYIPDLKLLIEIDGKDHEQKQQYDARRDSEIRNNKGYKIHRFKNEEVLTLDFRHKIISIIEDRLQQKKYKYFRHSGN